MLFCFSLLAVLLCHTVLANVCSHTYNSSPGNITAVSQETGNRCEFFIEAPKDSYIAINFTHIYNESLAVGGERTQSSECLPRVDVTEIRDKEEETMDYICLSNKNHPIPHVFQSKSRLLKLTFKWRRRRGGRGGGFQLVFNFHKKESVCQFRCDDQSCLPDTSLVCNDVPDCLDTSDEKQCSTQPTPTDSNIFILILAIVIVVVFLTATGIITCISMRMWRERRNMGDSFEHGSLHPHNTPLTTEVVYVPSSPEDHRPCGGQPNRVHTNYPPNIPVSQDGEEGYDKSQKHLRNTAGDPQNELKGELVRGPPNRTIYEGGSPPPYPHAHSVGLLDQPNGQLNTRILQHYHGSPPDRRCCSMASNNNNPGNSNLNVTGGGVPHSQHMGLHPRHHLTVHHGHQQQQQQQPPPPRTYSHSHPPAPGPLSRPGGSSTSSAGSSSLGPPPNYLDVVASYNNLNRRLDSDV